MDTLSIKGFQGFHALSIQGAVVFPATLADAFESFCSQASTVIIVDMNLGFFFFLFGCFFYSELFFPTSFHHHITPLL
jgi:hypothetical protein